jgi:hypothetical protein
VTTQVRQPDEYEQQLYCDDADCEAVAAPNTDEEIARAYEHWRWHDYLHGCSHGN